MNWSEARLAKSMLESPCHMWKHKVTNGVITRSSKIGENDATDVNTFNGLNQFK